MGLINIQDQVWDFGNTNAPTLILSVPADQFYTTYKLGTFPSGTFSEGFNSIFKKITQTSFQRTDLNGTLTTIANPYYRGTGDTGPTGLLQRMDNGGGYFTSAKNSVGSANNYPPISSFKWPISSPGAYNTEVWVYQAQYKTYPAFYQKAVVNVFQKSVSILEDITNVGSVVVNNTTTTVGINTTRKFRQNKSRGAELARYFLISIISNTGVNLATEGVDYQIISGTTLTDILEVKFIKVGHYRVTQVSGGYNSNSHSTEFSNSTNKGVSENYALTFGEYLVGTLGTVETITMPVLNPIVTIQNELIHSPEQTGYEMSNISVNYSIDISNASYVIKDLDTNISTTHVLSEVDWQNVILNSYCNIELQIKNKATNEIVVRRSGFGPHNNIYLPKAEYNFSYNITAK